jgi:hypothetical protein
MAAMHSADPGDAAWFAGGGERGARMRAKDWSVSPLGRPETWPESIKAAVSICLSSRFPIVLWVGPQLRILYNDAYIPFLGETKHPAALGEAGRKVWREIWPTIGPMHDEVAAGRATSVEDCAPAPTTTVSSRFPRVSSSPASDPILPSPGCARTRSHP